MTKNQTVTATMIKSVFALAGSALFAQPALAVAPISLQQSALEMVSLFFGDEKAQQDTANCTLEYRQNSNGNDLNGQIGAVNQFFCALEKTIGLKGNTTGKTASYPMYTWSNTIHAVVSGEAGGGAFNGFDHEAKIWVCSTGGANDCTVANHFYPAAYVTWSYAADKSINKGVLIEDDDVLHGGDGLGNNSRPTLIKWDLGTTSSDPRWSALQVFGYNGVYTNYYGETAYHGAVKTSTLYFTPSGGSNLCVAAGATPNQYNANPNNCPSATMRFMISVDTATNVAGSQFGIFWTGKAGETEFATKSDAASLTCLNRTATATDWDYVEDAGNACTTALPATTWPALLSAQEVGAKTSADLTPYWNGMATHPTALETP